MSEDNLAARMEPRLKEVDNALRLAEEGREALKLLGQWKAADERRLSALRDKAQQLRAAIAKVSPSR